MRKLYLLLSVLFTVANACLAFILLWASVGSAFSPSGSVNTAFIILLVVVVLAILGLISSLRIARSISTGDDTKLGRSKDVVIVSGLVVLAIVGMVLYLNHRDSGHDRQVAAEKQIIGQEYKTYLTKHCIKGRVADNNLVFKCDAPLYPNWIIGMEVIGDRTQPMYTNSIPNFRPL